MKRQDIEKQLIGGILQNRQLAKVIISKTKENHFITPPCQKIYKSAQLQFEKISSCDFMIIAEQTKIDSRELLRLMRGSNVNILNADEYLSILSKFIMEDKTRKLGIKLANFESKTGDGSDVVELLNGFLNNLDFVTDTTISDNQKIVEEIIQEISLVKSSGKQLGISTGISAVDSQMGSFMPGWLVVDGGRPGMGKSAYMLSEARSIMAQGHNVGIVSIEMSTKEMILRVISDITGKSTRDIRSGRIDIKQITREADRIITETPYIVEGINTKHEILYSIRELADKGCKVVYIDFLQLTNVGSKPNNSRNLELGEVSRLLKIEAVKSKITIVILSQLSRKVEERSLKEPQNSDLRDSGEIEQNADVIRLFYRPEYYGFDTYDDLDTRGIGYIIISKHRHGSVGKLRLAFDGMTTKWRDTEQSYQTLNPQDEPPF